MICECGQEFTPTKRTDKCKPCRQKIARDKHRNRKGGNPYKDFKVAEKWTKCVCPRCQQPHKLRLFWIGKLPAKKYCEPCDKIRNELDLSQELLVY